MEVQVLLAELPSTRVHGSPHKYPSLNPVVATNTIGSMTDATTLPGVAQLDKNEDVNKGSSFDNEKKSDDETLNGGDGQKELDEPAGPRWLTGKKLIIVHSAMLLSYVFSRCRLNNYHVDGALVSVSF